MGMMPFDVIFEYCMHNSLQSSQCLGLGLGVWLRVFPPPPGRTVLPGSMGRTAPFVRDPAIVIVRTSLF